MNTPIPSSASPTLIRLLIGIRRLTAWSGLHALVVILWIMDIGLAFAAVHWQPAMLAFIAVFLLASVISTVAFVHTIWLVWQRLWTSRAGHALLVGSWMFSLAVGDWLSRNAIHEAMGLYRSDVPVTYAALSFTGAILAAAAMTAAVIAVAFAGFWFFRVFIFTMMQQFGVIKLLDELVSLRVVQFLFRLRKGTRLPLPRSDIHVLGVLFTTMVGGGLIVAVIASLLQAACRNRQDLVTAAVYALDALAEPSSAWSRRTLRTDHGAYQMRLQGSTIIWEPAPAAPTGNR